MRTRRALTSLVVIAVASLALSGCTSAGSDDSPPDAAPKDGPNVLRVLAGSEVKDIEPLLADVEAETGIDVELSYTGTLDGTQLVASGVADGTYDATWFPSNRYLALLEGGSAAIKHEEKIMSSPVVLGIKHPDAVTLGWDTHQPTWAEIVSAVDAGRLSYGMTSPVSSNSGFSTLIEAATALSGTGDVLTEQDVTAVAPALTQLFAGQKLTAGSSGFLVDTFNADPDAVQAVFNYESVLKSVEVDGTPLDIVVPSDGVITADYPLSLLASASGKEDAYTKVATYLLTDAVQQRIAATTQRRTSTSAQAAADVFELPFPNQLSTVQSLISTYLSKIKKPSDEVLQTDTSGSMDGERLESLKASLTALTDAGSDKNSFVAFQSRETVNFVEFGSQIKADKSFTISETDRAESLGDIQNYIDSLRAGSGTAIYDSLETSYENALTLKAEHPDHFVSVTVFTDGENTDGDDYADFTRWYAQQVSADTGIQSIPAYVIVFGDANPRELGQLATLTGGKTFSASESAKLPSVFKEIRGYQ